jgi:transposase
VKVIEPRLFNILENLAGHQSAKAEACLKECGTGFLFVSPSSPDRNPVKMAFSKLKARLRKAAERNFDGLLKADGCVSN